MPRSHLLASPVALSVAAGPSIAVAADPRATPACKRGLGIAWAELTGFRVVMMGVALGVFLR
jgi:hypothetical protein